jgi:hypothetical protein
VGVTGNEVIGRRLRLIRRNAVRAVAVGLDFAADDLRQRAEGLAPQLEGFLIGSAAIQRRGNQNAQKRVVFFDTPYAVRMHEDTYNLGPVSRLKQSPDGPIGRKYLERPFRAQVAGYNRAIAETIRKSLRQSVR